MFLNHTGVKKHRKMGEAIRTFYTSTLYRAFMSLVNVDGSLGGVPPNPTNKYDHWMKSMEQNEG